MASDILHRTSGPDTITHKYQNRSLYCVFVYTFMAHLTLLSSILTFVNPETSVRNCETNPRYTRSRIRSQAP